MFSRVVKLAEAVARMAEKRLLPSALSSAEQRDAFSAEVRRGAFFSARTSNADYLQTLRDGVARVLAGGRDSDLGAFRLLMRETAAALGYTPEKGFPGDEATGTPPDTALGVPTAAPGSLQDLTSDERLNLIARWQERIQFGAGERAAQLEPARVRVAPALELVRFESREVPRGTADADGIVHSEGWPERWRQAGGPEWEDGRLIALKTDPVWERLGDEALFADAMGIPHPPYWFNSGCGTREVLRSEWIRRVTAAGQVPVLPEVAPLSAADVPAAPTASTRGLDDDLKAAAKAGQDTVEAGGLLKLREKLRALQRRDIEAARAAYAAGADGREAA